MTNELSKLYITNADIAEKDIASLRDAPNRGHTYGTNNLSASDLKARFDSLPKLLIERFNALLDKIKDGSLSEELKVDAEGTLAELNTKVDALLAGGGIASEIYDGAVVVEGAESGDSANLITFTIDSITYEGVEGMTWGEWISSSYNTVGLRLEGVQVHSANGWVGLDIELPTTANMQIEDDRITDSVAYKSYSRTIPVP